LEAPWPAKLVVPPGSVKDGRSHTRAASVPAPASERESKPATVDLRTPPTSTPAPADAEPEPRVVTLADDVPSADDPDIEGSHLVGAQVVQQLLGGRVIEETDT
jgi:hypothetical protein